MRFVVNPNDQIAAVIVPKRDRGTDKFRHSFRRLWIEPMFQLNRQSLPRILYQRLDVLQPADVLIAGKTRFWDRIHDS